MTGNSKGPIPALPLTVVTGFLGAGKTTFLNRLLRDPSMADTVVIINEFGEIGLDHLLVEAGEDGVALMQSGCLCCTIRGDLLNTLEGLLRKRDNGRIAPFRRVVIETTGLADPAPILHTVMSHPYLGLRYRLEGVVTLVDAVNGLATLDAHPEALKQAAVADRLVLTKLDIAAGAADLRARLAALNPLAGVLDARAAGAAARWLNEEAALAAMGRNAHRHADGVVHVDAADDAASAEARGQDAKDVNRHDGAIRAHAFATDRAIAAASLGLFIDLVRSAQGAKLLRLKGIVNVAEDPERPVVIHGVQHVFHPPEVLERWPDGDRRTRVVFIVRDMDPVFIEGLWKAFAGAG
jgi:G3E family GTPase